MRKQPICGGCNHSKSFHHGGTGRCHAFSCSCSEWVKPAPQDEPVEPAAPVEAEA